MFGSMKKSTNPSLYSHCGINSILVFFNSFCNLISSEEIKLQNELKKTNMEFIPQWEYKLGFVDFFIEPNICIFVDGNFWHNYPNGTEKDHRQEMWLKDNGFIVIRFWSHEI